MVVKTPVKRGRPKTSSSSTKSIKSNKPLMELVDGVVVVKNVYCRRCMQTKDTDNFYSAVDKILDKNGYMSVCKDCINEIYSKLYLAERDVHKAILRTCRVINLAYNNDTVDSTIKQVDGKDVKEYSKEFFGLYKRKLSGIFEREDNLDLTFKEPEDKSAIKDNSLDQSEETVNLVNMWGDGYSIEDYNWLENEYSKWIKYHKSDTMAEVTLLKEIVWKNYEIKKARMEGKSTSSLVKELQDLMKTASVDPAKSTIAGSSENRDTFSSFIKLIEEKEPAEYYKDKKLFEDFDNIGAYFRKYVTRPLKNFITQSRDFNVDSNDEEDDDELIESLSETVASMGGDE